MKSNLTLRGLQLRARALGFIVTKLDGEYAVRPKFASDALAYYTTDLQDAADTMEAEAEGRFNPIILRGDFNVFIANRTACELLTGTHYSAEVAWA